MINFSDTITRLNTNSLGITFDNDSILYLPESIISYNYMLVAESVTIFDRAPLSI